MMGDRSPLIALLLLLAGAGPGAAETTEGSLRTFMASTRYTDLLNRALGTLAPEVFQRCPALKSAGSRVDVTGPLRLGPDGLPVSGAWSQHFPISGCGNDTTINVTFNVLADGKIDTVVGVPGDSHAGATLQKDAFKFVSIAVRARPVDCARLSVLTTKFEGGDLRYPPKMTFGSVHPSPPWWETWTVVGCGRRWDVPVDFIPDATGTQVYQPAHIVER